MYQQFDEKMIKKWKEFFNLKDYRRKNKTFMHLLCEGDRLEAIKFLIEPGADVNREHKTRIKIFNQMEVEGYIFLLPFYFPNLITITFLLVFIAKKNLIAQKNIIVMKKLLIEIPY